jgi:hypothetical protein
VNHDLISQILDGLAGVPEMQPERPFDGNYDELVMEWISGLPVPEIAQRLTPPDQSPMDVAGLARAIEEVASYLFPWGFSAYLQIAEHTLGAVPAPTISTLPALVKYGVPDPIAAWSMSFGITTRSLSMSLAAEYSRQEGVSDPALFREWLTRQDPLDLAAVIGATSEQLAELASVLERTRRPTLSADLQRGLLLPRTGYVAVLAAPAARLAASGLRRGGVVQIVRDYESSLDRNSIRVAVDGEDIGSLDPASSAVLAIEIDAGLLIGAHVSERQATDGGGTLLILYLSEVPDESNAREF